MSLDLFHFEIPCTIDNGLSEVGERARERVRTEECQFTLDGDWKQVKR